MYIQNNEPSIHFLDTIIESEIIGGLHMNYPQLNTIPFPESITKNIFILVTAGTAMSFIQKIQNLSEAKQLKKNIINN